MTENEFLEKWHSERRLYEAWGDYVKEYIEQELCHRGIDLGEFLKIPVVPRLKDDDSLVAKAFYRPDKTYESPYSEIEDKVGLRFVVLLVADINVLVDIVTSGDAWIAAECRNFHEERNANPLLFTYQSVHFVLRPNGSVELNGLTLDDSVACEVQIRTLLQHAHAELTHDAVYKAKRVVQPNVSRTVAKSMALIETTDDFFSSVVDALSSGTLYEYKIVESLDSLFLEKIGSSPIFQKPSIAIWDAFEDLVEPNLVEKIADFLDAAVVEVVRRLSEEDRFYRQSVVFFVCWLLKKHRHRLIEEWPLPTEKLQRLANGIGVNISPGVH